MVQKWVGWSAVLLVAATWWGPISAQQRRPVFELGDGPWLYTTYEQGTRIRVSVVTKGLFHPWGIAFLPNSVTPANPMGDALITEREYGQVRLLRNGQLQAEPVAKLSEAFPVSQLFDIALHPNFGENGLVYFSYIKNGARPDGTAGYYVTTALLRGRFDGRRIVDVEEIFEAESWSTNFGGAASSVMFAPDGKLFLSSSHRLDLKAPQSLDSHIGKILRLNDDGSAPRDNPFVGRRGALPEIYSYGHRSVMRFAIHPETGAMWEIENGPQGGDEVNILQPGLNYGWPLATFGLEYDGSAMTSETRAWREGMQQPKLAWVPSITVSSLAFYTGDKFPAWKNNLFATSMTTGRLPGTGHIQRIVLNENGELRREQMLTDLHQRIRHIAQGPDGLLYLLTDENDGAVLRIEPAGAETTRAPEVAPSPSAAAPSVAASASASSAADDEPWFIEHDCTLCHQVDARTIGPSYRDIANRYTATDDTIELLAGHVIEGTVGSWGDTPMTAHSALDKAEAREMVKRILALKSAR